MKSDKGFPNTRTHLHTYFSLCLGLQLATFGAELAASMTHDESEPLVRPFDVLLDSPGPTIRH